MQESGIDFTDEIARLEERCKQLEEELYNELTPAQKMHMARHHSVRRRWITSGRYLPISSSCTATGCSRTIWRSSADLAKLNGCR